MDFSFVLNARLLAGALLVCLAFLGILLHAACDILGAHLADILHGVSDFCHGAPRRSAPGSSWSHLVLRRIRETVKVARQTAP